MNVRNEYLYKHTKKHINRVKQHTPAGTPLALGAPLLMPLTTGAPLPMPPALILYLNNLL
jgi:hypothetical protein